MSKVDDGGAAFPRVNPEYTKNNDGMALRDWFAGQALAGLAAQPWVGWYQGNKREQMKTRARAVTPAAYELADAMLAERAKES